MAMDDQVQRYNMLQAIASLLLSKHLQVWYECSATARYKGGEQRQAEEGFGRYGHWMEQHEQPAAVCCPYGSSARPTGPHTEGT